MGRGYPSDRIFGLHWLCHKIILLKYLAESRLNEVVVVVESAKKVFSGRVAEALIDSGFLQCLQMRSYH